MSGSNGFQGQVDVNLKRVAWRFQREIPLDSEEVERILNKRAVVDPDDYAASQKRKAQMMQDLFVAATKVLTDVQFQFFTSYYVVGMSEVQIAEAFNCTQPYVSIVLSACIKKIKKAINT